MLCNCSQPLYQQVGVTLETKDYPYMPSLKQESIKGGMQNGF